MHPLGEKLQSLLTRMKEICEQEKNSLQFNKVEELIQQVEIKSRLVEEIIALDAEYPDLKKEIENIEALPEYAGIKELIQHCAQKNNRNGQLISLLQRQIRSLLLILQGESLEQVINRPENDFYNSEGKKTGNFDSHLELIG